MKSILKPAELKSQICSTITLEHLNLYNLSFYENLADGSV